MRRFPLFLLIVAGAACGMALGFHKLVDAMRWVLIGAALHQHTPLRYALVIAVPAVASSRWSFDALRRSLRERTSLACGARMRRMSPFSMTAASWPRPLRRETRRACHRKAEDDVA